MIQKVERMVNNCSDFIVNSVLLTDIQAAPIWDSRKRRFVGLMTVTDFIDILRKCTHRLVAGSIWAPVNIF